MTYVNFKRTAGDNIIECFIDRSAIIHSSSIVWWYARVLAGCNIGANVSIGAGTEVGFASTIGDDSRIGANCFFPSNTAIGARVFVGPGVVCTDDRHPRVLKPGDPPYHAEPPIIEDDANIGARAVLLPGVRIGEGALVAAGAIVAEDVLPYTIVRCEKARVFAPSAATTSAYGRDFDG